MLGLTDHPKLNESDTKKGRHSRDNSEMDYGMTVEDVCGAQGLEVVYLLGGCVGDYGCEAEDFAEDFD